MKLVVKNFGPIKECAIDLSKHYYFFIGYNNTGKTYLAKLIYDIFNRETLEDFIKTEFAQKITMKTGELTLSEELIRSVLNDFSKYLKEVVIPKSLKINSDNNFILNDLDIYFDFNLKEDVEMPPLKSGVSIGIEAADQATNNVDKYNLDIYTLKKEENSLKIKYEYFTHEDINKKLPDGFFDSIPKNKFEQQINSIRKSVPTELNQTLLSLLLQNKEKPFFLPANRIFILENADELVEQDNKRNEELAKSLLELFESGNNTNKEKLSNLIAKRTESNHTMHISYLIDEISKLRKNKDENFVRYGTGFYDNVISNLSQLMGGEIVISKSNAISNWEEKFKIGTQEENEQPLSMYLASSSVNQLGTLFLYLKYWARSENNFLMIDEPEENLHPESQIKLINVLLDFASKGNRVLITTHSPLVSEVINNYLILNQLDNKSELAKELGLMDTDFMPNKVGVYYFNGEIVSEHDVNKYGTIFTSFKEAQDKVYAIGEYLGETMFKQINKS